MTKWVHADVLDGGLNGIKTAAIRVLLISGYTAADSYATVVAAKIGEATMASGDYTLGTSGSNRTLTTGTKSSTASAASAAIVATRAATAGSATTLTDSTQSWTTNDKAGKVLTAISGAGSGRSEVIISNTATVLTVATGTAFDNTTTYRITNNHHLAYTDNSAKVLWVTDETGNDPVAISDTINFPAVVYTNAQPT